MRNAAYDKKIHILSVTQEPPASESPVSTA